MASFSDVPSRCTLHVCTVARLNVCTFARLHDAPAPASVWHAASRLRDVAALLSTRGTKNQKVLSTFVKQFLREIQLLSKLEHENVMRLVGAAINEDVYCMVTDYMANGDLYEYIRDYNHTYAPTDILSFASDVCKGMIYLHAMRIVQRDLKTRNLLVDSHMTIKIADFGLSRSLNEQDIQATHCGTPFWSSPEMLSVGGCRTTAMVCAATKVKVCHQSVPCPRCTPGPVVAMAVALGLTRQNAYNAMATRMTHPQPLSTPC